ncbi:MAG: hypothetical protein Aurels2KO_29140 [Aureliella sp.]
MFYVRLFLRYSLEIAVLCALATAPAVGQTAKYDDDYAIQGFSQPIREAMVASPISGIVQQRVAREGQTVAKDELLVRLDSRVYEARLMSARVTAHAKGELDIARAELEVRISRQARLEELAKRNHATEVELTQAGGEVAIARANLQRAQDRQAQQDAECRRLEAELEQHLIRAPFSGVVVELAKELGEYVGAGDVGVAKIADLSELSVEFMLPRSLRSKVKLDDEVKVVFTSSRKKLAGRVTFISPYPNGDSGTYMLKVIVDNREGALNAGERCLLQGMQ